MATKIEHYRELIESENRRISERFAILTQFQGLLFASFSLILCKIDTPYNEHFYYFLFVLAAVGILSAASIFYFLNLAGVAINDIWNEYQSIPKDQRDLEGPIIGHFRAFENRKEKFIKKICSPHRAIPLLLIIAWTIISFIIFSFI